jgi:zinc/manganese transport system ATP-binding protein
MDRKLPSATLQDVTISYERHPAVHHVSGTLAGGSLTAIVGPNGAGKSSLIKALAGLIQPSEGRVAWHGCSHEDIAFLPQLTAIDDNFPMAVRDVVLMGHWRKSGALGSIGAAMQGSAQDALAAVGLAGFDHRLFSSLSVGQQQRVLFARLMVADCPVILLDEPFSAIDSRTADDLLRLIHRWHREGRTVVAVLHDLAQVRQHFPQTLLLARRLLGWGPTAAVLTEEALRQARSMGEAWDEHAEPCSSAA